MRYLQKTEAVFQPLGTSDFNIFVTFLTFWAKAMATVQILLQYEVQLTDTPIYVFFRKLSVNYDPPLKGLI